jgi:hypothetical protein
VAQQLMAHDALGAYALSAGIVLILENRNRAASPDAWRSDWRP